MGQGNILVMQYHINGQADIREAGSICFTLLGAIKDTEDGETSEHVSNLL